MNLFYYFQAVSWEGFVDKINHVFQPVIDFFTSLGDNEKTSRYAAMVISMAEGKLKSFLKNLMESTLLLPAFLGRFFIGLIIALYILIDKDSFLSFMRRVGEKLLTEKEETRFLKSGRNSKEFSPVI